jgi:hypothetical protein
VSTRKQPRWRAPLLLVAAALFAVLIPAVFYVWGHTQIVTLGYRIESARLELRRLEDRGRALELDRTRLMALQRIESRARRLGLTPAPPERIIIVRPRTGE